MLEALVFVAYRGSLEEYYLYYCLLDHRQIFFHALFTPYTRTHIMTWEPKSQRGRFRVEKIWRVLWVTDRL